MKKINVANRKYTFVQTRGDLPIVILRHGWPWISIHDGTNALSAIMAELDAARVVVEAARNVCAEMHGDACVILHAALNKHAALVDDNEPPSEWTT